MLPQGPIIFNKREYKKLTKKQYSSEKYRLQVELLKLQESVIKEGRRLAILFQGRDAAGKGSTIRRFIEHLMPDSFRVVRLGIPTDAERENWFERYEKELPKPGEIVFFDRSWYNRALVEPTMGYCNLEQYTHFMNKVVSWEEELIGKGLELTKFYLSVNKNRQLFRFEERKNSPLKYWKYSENDSKIATQFERYTFFKEEMFLKTSPSSSPWVIIDSNVKMIARLNAIRYVLNAHDYQSKVPLPEKKWTVESAGFEMKFLGVDFQNLSEEQLRALEEAKDKLGE